MSMSPWVAFFVGLIVGGLIGLVLGRRNYESCRGQLDKMIAEMQARKAELSAMEAEIEDLQHSLSTPASQVAATSPEDAPASASVATAPAQPAEREVAPKPVDSETRVSHCPQKLARIRGIGRVYEDKLFQAGIGTFWQVATASNEKLAAIFAIQDFQAVDLDAIKEDARRLAEETGTMGRVWSGQKPDDFESLPGIGKTYEARLYDAGVCTFAKLAAMTEAEIAAIVKAPKWNQPDYAAWIAFAQAQVQKSA